MQERRFEPRLGLEFSGFTKAFSVWHSLRLVVKGFLKVLRFPPFLCRLTVSDNKKRAKIDEI